MKITASIYHAALAFAAKEGTRTYLCGVHYEPHPTAGAFVAATDGHAMVVMHDALAEDVQDVTLPAVKLGAPDRRYGTLLAYDPVAQTLRTSSGISVPCAPIAGSGTGSTFPDWRMVIPRSIAPAHPIPPFSTALLARFSNIPAAFGSQTPPAVRLDASASATAAILVHTGYPAFGLVMPYRADRSDFEMASALLRETERAQ